MSLMKWSDDLSVGIPEIDKQHQVLVGLINTLHESMMNKQGKQVVKKILDELAEYTVTHFTYEEKYMLEFKFVGYMGHKKEHDAFVAKVKDFIAEYEANKLGLSLELLTFLRDWIVNHIMGTDKGYTSTFHKHGL
jgi:hemerythrin